MKDSVFSP